MANAMRHAIWKANHRRRATAHDRATSANRRAAALGLWTRVTPDDIEALWDVQPSCQHCGVTFMGVDHIRSMARGGANAPDNIQNLCRQCNRLKEGREKTEMAAARTHCPSDHPYAIHGYQQRGRRYCRECQRASTRASRARV